MKIVVRMLGGLGNQLFQYAYARYLMSLYPNSEIYLDLREYEKYKVRKFDLDSILLNKSVYKYTKNRDIYYDITRKSFHLYQYLYRKKFNKPLTLGPKFLLNKGLIYSGIDAHRTQILNKKTVYLYGYFQDIKIVEPIRDILLSEFAIKHRISENASKYLNLINKDYRSIAISIRCGKDYIDSGWPVCNIKYYKEGLEILKRRYNDYKIFVFADEIDKVKNEFGFSEDVIYIEGCSPIESLELLKNCDDFVISNSSFAWWGAYLSNSTEKLIIMPNEWFVGLETIKTSLVLENKMMILN